MEIEIIKRDKLKFTEVDFNNLKFGKIFSDHMFISDFDGEKWHSHRIVPFENMVFSPANSMIHYGQSIFEGLKAFRSLNDEISIFRPQDNAKRLQVSAKRLCMEPLPEEIFIKGLTELLKIDKNWIPQSDNASMYIRPFEFAMDNFLGIDRSIKYRFVIILSPSGSYYNKDLKVKIEQEYTRATLGGIGFIKAAGNYAKSLYPTIIAKDKGIDQLIWTDSKEHKYVEEFGTMNLMMVLNGTLITPPLTSTILPGITRDSILKIAKNWNMNIEERKISVVEIKENIENGNLTEMFGVGTAAIIAHIREIVISDKLYSLPDYNTKNSFSIKIKKYLKDLKRGKIQDIHQWIYKI